MIVIVPVDIIDNPSRLYSTNIAIGTGEDPPVWSSASAWDPGDRAYVSSPVPEVVYEVISSATISAGGTSPTTNSVSATPSWFNIGYINKWSMFDLYKNTTTISSAGNITFEVRPGVRIDSLAFLNMANVTNISITATDEYGVTVYPTSSVAISIDYYVVTDIPRLSTIRLQIVITGTGTISIGTFVCGNYYYIGEVQDGAEVGSENFSSIERDEFGNAAIVKRKSVAKLSKTLFITADMAKSVYVVRDLLNAVPAVWVGLHGNTNTNIASYYNSLVLLGFYRAFNIELSSPVHATVELELEEM